MSADQAIKAIRDVTKGSSYEGKLFLVGGYVRDKLLGRPLPEDIDIVLEGDGVALAQFLHMEGISSHAPVIYPRFGTAKLMVHGVDVEIVGARRESYESESRKPTVHEATLLDDAVRRDFTVNTLMENLHTGAILDPLGRARADLERRVIVTPLDPVDTFKDDPLRMLRAIRFAVRLDFEIDPACEAAIRSQADRLKIVSGERIRDEVVKMLMGPRPGIALREMQQTGLLALFAPELEQMVGVEQNDFHIYDVWEHTMRAIEALPPEANLVTRLGLLLHDLGKPATKSTDAKGNTHFYLHEDVGLEPAAKLLRRLRLPNDTSRVVLNLVKMHMRPGGYNKRWSDGAVRRLLRDAGEHFDELMMLCRADAAARRLDVSPPEFEGLLDRVRKVEAKFDAQTAESPLSGEEIMAATGRPASPEVGKLKAMLADAVLDGSLKPEDKEGALSLLREALRKT